MSPSTPSPSSTTSSGSVTVISPTGSLTISGECATYEEGFLVPLARINYKLVAPLLNSHSSINYICGLLPSPSLSPSPSASPSVIFSPSASPSAIPSPSFFPTAAP
jgi:hypothetical protein